MPRQRSSWGSNSPARRKGYRTLRFWADLHDGRGYMRHTKTIKGTRKDGDAELARIRIAHDGDRPCPTIGQAYELWYLPEKQALVDEYLRNPRPGRRGETLKPQSMKQLLSLWRAHVAPAWANVPASDVRFADVQEWLNGMTTQNANKALGMLRDILRYCLMNENIDKNVCEYTYRLPARGNKFENGVWTLDELNNKVWPAVYGTIAEPGFLLSAFGSCRTGECLTPLLDEVEEVHRSGMTLVCIPILRQVSYHGSVSAEGDLKTAWSPRPIVLPEPWSKRILQLRDEGIANGDKWLSDNGTGKPIGQGRLGETFKKCLDDAGIKRQQFRTLRRSWRTWIAGMGISREILEKMMGHIGEGTTGKHYLKLTRDLIIEEVAMAFSERPIEFDWDKLG